MVYRYDPQYQPCIGDIIIRIKEHSDQRGPLLGNIGVVVHVGVGGNPVVDFIFPFKDGENHYNTHCALGWIPSLEYIALLWRMR